MSRGQTYSNLANDVFRAIFHAKLLEYEAMIAQYVIENTWGKSAKRGRKGSGWPDTRPIKLNLSSLSILWEVPAQRLYEAHTNLVKSRMILSSPSGSLMNKNADEWIDPKTGSSRIPPKRLEYAASAQQWKDETSEEAFTPERENESRTVFTPRRNASENFFTPDRETSANTFTPERETSTIAFTPDRGAALEDRTRGNPTGSNTNSTRSNTNASEIGNAPAEEPGKGLRKARIDIPKQRGLALSEDEPFISPPDALPIPVPESEDDPETVRLVKRLHPYILENTRTRHTPEGNGDIAEFMVRQARLWRQQNYPAAVIRDSIKKAVDAGVANQAMPLSRYVVKCLSSYAAQQASLSTAAPAIKPSQTKPMTYHTASTKRWKSGGNP